jgi:hypothetical protein
MKRFAVTKRVTLRVEGNVFTAVNHANLAVPNGDLSSPFLRTGYEHVRTTTPRQIQLGARLSF